MAVKPAGDQTAGAGLGHGQSCVRASERMKQAVGNIFTFGFTDDQGAEAFSDGGEGRFELLKRFGLAGSLTVRRKEMVASCAVIPTSGIRPRAVRS